MSHTPGPWSYKMRMIYSGDRKLMYSTNGADFMTDAENYANARLMAAAPCLYEALKAVEANMEETDSDIGDFYDLVGKVKAAIAKAEGK